jgi:uncharacterized protein (TIGR00725 family)
VSSAYVAVCGASQASAEQAAAAEAVGEGLARGGAVLVCGGRGGVMEAACRGAASVGGLTVGLLPGLDRAEANPWVSIALPTGLGELRNGLVVRAADAVVAVGGAWGTLSEVALALHAGTPVVGLGTFDLEGVVAAADPGDAVARVLRLASSTNS